MINMKKALFTAAAAIAFTAAAANAQHIEACYDWEDGEVSLGSFSDGAVIILESSTEQAHSGSRSLKFTEELLGGTPQAYIAYVENLVDGDIITAGVWIYDDTPNASPSGRIWGHYADPGDPNSFRGSAGGNFTYSDGSGWSYLEHTWVFDADCGHPNGCREALMIEVRLYSGTDGDFVYIDDVDVTVDSTGGNATVSFAGMDVCGGDDYLLEVGTLVAGQNGQFQVTGADPNQTQYLVYSLQGPGSTPVPQLGVVLDLARPTLAAQKRANGNGVANWTLPIPGNAQNRRAWFQCAQQGSTTNVVDRVIQ